MRLQNQKNAVTSYYCSKMRIYAHRYVVAFHYFTLLSLPIINIAMCGVHFMIKNNTREHGKSDAHMYTVEMNGTVYSVR